MVVWAVNCDGVVTGSDAVVAVRASRQDVSRRTAVERGSGGQWPFSKGQAKDAGCFGGRELHKSRQLRRRCFTRVRECPSPGGRAIGGETTNGEPTGTSSLVAVHRAKTCGSSTVSPVPDSVTRAVQPSSGRQAVQAT